MKPTHSLPSAQNPIPEPYYYLAVMGPHINVLFIYVVYDILSRCFSHVK